MAFFMLVELRDIFWRPDIYPTSTCGTISAGTGGVESSRALRGFLLAVFARAVLFP
jgi:hypothetical protein